MKTFAGRQSLLLAAICLGLSLGATRPAGADDDEYPSYRVRRFGPYVTPDLRATAPTLTQAIGDGLLPPFGWGWYGVGYPGAWGWGYWGGYWGPHGGSFPYPYGFNGRFWYPNGPPSPYAPSWPYTEWAHRGHLPPMGYSVYPLQFPYGPYRPDDEAAHAGQYYW